MSLRQFIHINEFIGTVRVDENIQKQIGGEKGAFFVFPFVRYNVAVPSDQIVILRVKPADFDAFVQIVAGIAVVQYFLGFQGIPPGQDVVVIRFQNDIVLQ